MKKIFIVLSILCIMCISLFAQKSNSKKVAPQKQEVCKAAPGGGAPSCYSSIYAQNYKVCRNQNGYYICSGVENQFDLLYLKYNHSSEQRPERVNKENSTDLKPSPLYCPSVPMNQSYPNVPNESR